MDVDIDLGQFNSSNIFPDSTRASVVKDEKLTPHPCGVYFQDIATDPISGLAAIPYEAAERAGYFKVDFLHIHVYDHFTSREEIKELLKHDPDWGLLEIPSVVAQLFQVSKHYDLISLIKPTSIMELADCLALIRPQKRYLKDLYLRNCAEARKLLYAKEQGSDAYSFKKAHAYSYSMVIVLQLHLIKGGIKLT
jgi:hypothetical protein